MTFEQKSHVIGVLLFGPKRPFPQLKQGFDKTVMKLLYGFATFFIVHHCLVVLVM